MFITHIEQMEPTTFHEFVQENFQDLLEAATAYNKREGPNCLNNLVECLRQSADLTPKTQLHAFKIHQILVSLLCKTATGGNQGASTRFAPESPIAAEIELFANDYLQALAESIQRSLQNPNLTEENF
ncbi:hypothetical protein [Sulfitobacter sp. 915]|uniref:hypothetical protein n=1 Tax=Sulfitobacter sp. 915 TaxID=3368558 RepID=UPI003745C258